jgi:hypothetical protein
LHFWGECLAFGHAPGSPRFDPQRYRLASTFGSRAPSPDEHTDLWRAFLALNPSTVPLPPDTAAVAYYRRLAFVPYTLLPGTTRAQAVIWRFYVAGDGLRDPRAHFARLAPPARDTRLDDLDRLRRANPDAPELDDDDGDARVARHIPNLRDGGHLSPARVNVLRNDAIRAMCAFLNHRPRVAAPA